MDVLHLLHERRLHEEGVDERGEGGGGEAHSHTAHHAHAVLHLGVCVGVSILSQDISLGYS